jgi:hypothetical protein
MILKNKAYKKIILTFIPWLGFLLASFFYFFFENNIVLKIMWSIIIFILFLFPFIILNIVPFSIKINPNFLSVNYLFYNKQLYIKDFINISYMEKNGQIIIIDNKKIIKIYSIDFSDENKKAIKNFIEKINGKRKSSI